MNSWDFSPPTQSNMGDHDVPKLGHHLEGQRVALMVCGGIAAMKAPLVARALRRYGAEVQAYVSSEALRYVTKETLQWATTLPVIDQLSPESEHLSKANPIDAFLMVPATYNSINKFRHGIADTPITATLAAALGLMEKGQVKILVAPTMHGDMHNSILTESLTYLSELGVQIIPPRDAYGKHNIPDEDVLVAETIRAVCGSSLRGKKIMVTGGPTPVPIDSVRRFTNKFSGRLSLEIAKELYYKGADVQLVLGGGVVTAPSFIETIQVPTYDAYKETVVGLVKKERYWAGVFSAAVADYRPVSVVEGKIPSQGELKSIELEPTEKVLDLVQEFSGGMKLVSFKYQENMSHEELMNIARDRISKGHAAVVANRGEEQGPQGEQVAYLVGPDEEPEVKAVGKTQIAQKIAEWLSYDQ